jgi:[protein-PII] uridylyltransferase
MDVILDRIGLKIGYAYRVLDDYETLDFVTKTALLDSRPIAGNPEIAEAFTRDLRATLKADYVIQQARSRPKPEQIEAASLYAVEPNVKSGPGGLRDIHVAAWIGQALFDCGTDDVWRELVERRVITPAHSRALAECREFIGSVRNALHISSGRTLDVLTVERQAEVAALLGLEDEFDLMHRYYSNAEKLRWICNSLIDVLSSRRLPLDRVFYLTNGMLALGDKPVALTRPGVMMRAFRHAQECSVGFSPQLEEQVRAVVESGSTDIGDKQSYSEFHSILEGDRVYATLSHMASLGTLQGVIPEFGVLLHRVPAERVHEFTIGEHSLLVLRRLEEMKQEQETLYSGIWGSVKDPAALYFAALMHDIGKDGSGDHQESGAKIAEELARRLGFPESSVGTIRFLVANHQLMSETARRCDVTSVATVADFTAKVKDIHLLRMLFLLSVADAVSVGQMSWGEMQRRFLEELYFVAESHIMGPRVQDESERAERYRRRLHRELTLANLPEEIVHEHCNVMPPAYLLNTRPVRMAKHIEGVIAVRKGKTVVRMDEDLMDRVTELTVCAPDKGPGLMKRITGVLFALDVTVHSAAVFTRKTERDSIAIDTLSIDYLRDRLPYMKRKEVERELQRVLSGEMDVEDLIEARGKEIGAVPVKSVQLLGRHSETHSIVEVRADDVDGLLYYVTRAMARLGWNILSARIATLGHQVIDTFAVSDRNGNRLPTAAASMLKQEFNGRE